MNEVINIPPKCQEPISDETLWGEPPPFFNGEPAAKDSRDGNEAERGVVAGLQSSNDHLPARRPCGELI